MSKSEQLNILYNRYGKQFEGKEIVVGDGNPDSSLLLIGEAPGKDEVAQKRPFVGMAGKNLAQFLEILGFSREEIYITNAIKHRLSKINPDTGRVSNRPATKEEIEQNREYLIEEIAIIEPKYIVTLGNVPLRSVLGDYKASIGEFHGRLNKVVVLNKEYKLYPLYHPASIIYNAALKEIYIKDLQNLREIIVSTESKT
ncbi:uracil-DNA glycosylase [Acetivibrio clariflavus]|uniref:Type-4 uracil-DNA glycosylase n=1 Tax=Acetivibrio clariflavus (strain DSM 19732 / NBRC 101661 / EBR45) TaxID=720554 RepID=G8LWR8_ACECE|nr:uracil-DNA glycosylase [Acetivibrio clariflavus]AEV69779.1 uracil-DNA glycosylase, family 4 [Acetivibrio clariflavus DSM 19732]